MTTSTNQSSLRRTGNLSPRAKVRQKRAVFIFCSLLTAGTAAAGDGFQPLSPSDVVATRDGQTLYISAGTGNKVLRHDASKGTVDRSITVPGSAWLYAKFRGRILPAKVPAEMPAMPV